MKKYREFGFGGGAILEKLKRGIGKAGNGEYDPRDLHEFQKVSLQSCAPTCVWLYHDEGLVRSRLETGDICTEMHEKVNNLNYPPLIQIQIQNVTPHFHVLDVPRHIPGPNPTGLGSKNSNSPPFARYCKSVDPTPLYIGSPGTKWLLPVLGPSRSFSNPQSPVRFLPSGPQPYLTALEGPQYLSYL